MFLLVGIILLWYPYEASIGAMEGMKIAFERVVPSVLPFAMVSAACVCLRLPEKMVRVFAPLFKKIRLNPYGGTVFLMGSLGGYPTGARMVCDLYNDGMVEKEEAERMLSYVNNGGIMFALNVIGIGCFNSKNTGMMIFAVSLLASLISGMIFGRSNVRERYKKTIKKPPRAVLGKSIASMGGVMLNIVSSFVVFYAISYALSLGELPLLNGVWEMTQGINYAKAIHSVPLATFFFTLGGGSVFAQSSAICAECEFSMKRYVAGKITAACMAFVIAWVLTK